MSSLTKTISNAKSISNSNQKEWNIDGISTLIFAAEKLEQIHHHHHITIQSQIKNEIQIQNQNQFKQEDSISCDEDISLETKVNDLPPV